ncbi:MAG TPA: dihydrolipoamide acetyltransferase family protein [Candidatus Brocadiia bacterium]|nr:dihydrolipoamide acetyltransferase family protein [Candidatus Brocadiia bacterium]
MIQEVLMPKLGQTMESAVIEKWLKKPGDRVAKGDVLMEIQTDKANLEVESFVDGTLLAHVGKEGETFPVNTVVALIGAPGDALPDIETLRAKALSGGAAPAPAAAPAAAPAPAVPAAAPAPPPVAAAAPAAPAAAAPAPAGRIFASPRARSRAAQEKVPLAILRGSGPDGRIVEKDVLAYLDRIKDLRATPVAREIALEKNVDLSLVKGTGPGGKITKEDVEAAAASAPAARVAAAPVAAAAAAPAAAVPGAAAPLSAMRRIVASRMSQSKREAPHFYITMEVDMSAVVAMRKSVNAQGRVKVSYHDFLIKACGRAFAEQPAMNVSFAGDGIVRRAEINVGLAVSIDDGLMVPVVKNVDKLSLAGVAEKSHELIEKARSKRLTPDEYQGGGLTISNLGMFDVDWFYPIINPGESAIIGVGRIVDKVVVINGGIHIRPIMTLAMAADHRAVDGAVAAAFLKRVKELLQTPAELQ